MTSYSIIQTRSQKSKTNKERDYNSIIKLNKKSNEICSVNGINLWLEDSHIDSYCNSFAKQLSYVRDDVKILSTSETELLKLGSLHQVTEFFTSIDYHKVNYMIFSLNNCSKDEVSKIESLSINKITDPVLKYCGNHWSLIVYSKITNHIYHFDSIRGLNKNSAKLLNSNIGFDATFVEVQTIQQISNFECGIHTIVNCQYIINNFFLNKNCTNFDRFLALNFMIEKETIPVVTKRNTSQLNEENEAISLELNKKLSVRNITINNTDTDEVAMNHGIKWITSHSKTLKNKKLSKIKSKEMETLELKNRFHLLTTDTEEIHNKNNTNERVQTKGINSECYFDKSYKKDNLNNKIKRNCFQQKSVFSECKNSINNSRREKETLNDKNEIKIPFEVSNIKILSDSHGRDIAMKVRNYSSYKYQVLGSVKPNGKTVHVLNNLKSDIKNMNKNDVIVIISGTNDIDFNVKTNKLVEEIEEKIKDISGTNIIISAIPFRYDFPFFNKNIRIINKQLQKMCEKYINVHYMPLYSLNIEDYTKYGLHLNNNGKNKLSKLILEHVEYIIKGYRHIPVQISTANCFLGKNLLYEKVP